MLRVGLVARPRGQAAPLGVPHPPVNKLLLSCRGSAASEARPPASPAQPRGCRQALILKCKFRDEYYEGRADIKTQSRAAANFWAASRPRGLAAPRDAGSAGRGVAGLEAEDTREDPESPGAEPSAEGAGSRRELTVLFSLKVESGSAHYFVPLSPCQD